MAKIKKRSLIKNRYSLVLFVLFLFLLLPMFVLGNSINLVKDSSLIIKVNCNSQHNLMINGTCGKYILASEVKVGDELLRSNGKAAKITSIKDVQTEKPFNVTNISVKNYHNIILPDGVIIPDGNFPVLDDIDSLKKNLGIFNENLKPIQDIKIGDSVLSYNPTLKTNVPAKATNIFDFWRNDYYIIKTDSSNEEIRVTPEHPFFVDGSWVLVKDLKLGDELLTDTGEKTKITKITLVHTDNLFEVFNLEVDGNHTYYASGVLVHNKDYSKFSDAVDLNNLLPGETQKLANIESYYGKPLSDIQKKQLIAIHRYGEPDINCEYSFNDLKTKLKMAKEYGLDMELVKVAMVRGDLGVNLRTVVVNGEICRELSSSGKYIYNVGVKGKTYGESRGALGWVQQHSQGGDPNKIIYILDASNNPIPITSEQATSIVLLARAEAIDLVRLGQVNKPIVIKIKTDKGMQYISWKFENVNDYLCHQILGGFEFHGDFSFDIPKGARKIIPEWQP